MNELRGAKRLIIPGKIEQRYADEKIEIGGEMQSPWQGFILREILVEDYNVDPAVIEWIRSDGGTFEAVRSIVDKIRDLGLQFREVIVVTNKYHHERVYEMLRDFRAYEVCVRSAESLLMAADETRCEKFLAVHLDQRALRARYLDEAKGVGAFISRRYNSRRHGWKKTPVFR
ncbi:MAG TPA: hypothetical protein VMU27_03195 [Candidatus Paceibacterota bacterium]|nr:hypothetical protein [Candidatus Paceibacterota bacterium]